MNTSKERVGWNEEFTLNGDVECVKIYTYELGSGTQPTGDLLSTSYYLFNKNGDTTYFEEIGKDRNQVRQINYSYNDDGKLISQSPNIEYEYSEYLRFTINRSNYTREELVVYDSNGRITCKIWLPYWEINEYHYNHKGHLISITTNSASGYTETRVLDEDGKILKQREGWCDYGWNVTYIYDSNDLLIRKNFVGAGAGNENECYRIDYQEYDKYNNPQIIKVIYEYETKYQTNQIKLIEITYR